MTSLNSQQTENTENVQSGSQHEPLDVIFTLPNVVTFIRLLLIPFYFVLLLIDPHENRFIACVIFAIAASTDWVDGKLARKTKTVSKLGKVLDPLVDRALLFSGVLALYLIDEIPLWILIIVIGRDFFLALILGPKYYKKDKSEFDVIYIGKATTLFLLVGFAFLLLGFPIIPGLSLFENAYFPGFNSNPANLGIWFVYVGILLSLITAGIYTLRALNSTSKLFS